MVVLVAEHAPRSGEACPETVKPRVGGLLGSISDHPTTSISLGGGKYWFKNLHHHLIYGLHVGALSSC